MTLRYTLGWIGMTAWIASAVILGCNSSSSTPEDSGAPTPDSGGPTPDSGGPTPDGGGGNDATTTDSGGGNDAAIPLDCNDYCTAIMNACQGSQAQYQSKAECLTVCALFPAGAAQTGNTLGCRVYHTQLAETKPNPHCWHAGPYGFSVCGAPCDNFCALDLAYCNADAGLSPDAGAPNPPYAALTDCTTACAGFATIPEDAGADAAAPPLSAYNAGGTGDVGDTAECREYHLMNAFASTANQQIHCAHTAATSAVCHN